MRRLLRLSTIVAMALALAGCGDEEPARPGPPPSAPNKAAAECWEKIKTVDAVLDYEAHEIDAYWWDVAIEVRAVFWAYLQTDGDEAGLKYLWGQFGKHGARADLRLLLSDRILMLPIWFSSKMPLVREQHGISADDYHRLRTYLCRVQVEQMLGDKELLHRYYRAALYEGSVVNPDIVKFLEGVRVTFDGKIGDDEYWCHARNFLLLAYATDRLDLLENANAADLKSVAAVWKQWWGDNYDKMVFDKKSLQWRKVLIKLPRIQDDRYEHRLWREGKLPAGPFEDWQGPPPPTPIVLSAIYDNAGYEKVSD